MSDFAVSGGPTEEESAAIGAVVAHVLSQEADVVAKPPPRPRQSDWVLAWKPRVPRLQLAPEAPKAATDPDEED